MYILGIDCGGTSTDALLTTLDGAVLGRGQGGPANFTTNGVGGVVQSSYEAMQKCLAESGLDLAEIQPQVTLALGVSGAGRAAEQHEVRQKFEAAGFSSVVVAHDAHIALLGALSGADGVAVIAGTGSIAYGLHAGRSHRVGGWGYLLGDEGGAFWIALQALQRVMRAYDGRLPQDQVLLEAVKNYFHVNGPSELVPIIYKMPLDRGFIGGFCAVIGKLAEQGHGPSREILAAAGCQLGRLAVAALAELGLAGKEGRVAACGGVFSAGKWVLDPMQEMIKLAAPGQRLSLPDFKPAAGAVFLAARHLGLQLPLISAGLRGSLDQNEGKGWGTG